MQWYLVLHVLLLLAMSILAQVHSMPIIYSSSNGGGGGGEGGALIPRGLTESRDVILPCMYNV